ncbi:MAG: acyl carrier protein [Acholeplasmatales bacterium]|nr:acyl carrier protein [Acholeplasmatales bacterium]
MVFDEVKKIIVDELNVNPDKITLEASLSEDLGADSLDAVEVIMDLEDKYGITIDDEAAKNIKTVKDLVDYIEAHKA